MKGLVDTYNRKIDYIRISVTDRCNLRCIYCMPSEGVREITHTEILTYEEIIRILSIATQLGIKKVRITGGEPLVRKGLPSLIKAISDIKEIEEISLTTNGVLLKRFAKELKDAGLQRLNISLDSMDPKRYEELTRGNNLSDVWEGIRAAEELGFSPIKINMVPIRGFNDNEIKSFAALTFDKPHHIRFIEFMPTGAKEIWSKDKCISVQEIKDIISELGELKPIKNEWGSGPAKNFRIGNAKGVVGLISAISDHFCAGCNRLRLTSDGKLRPCLFSSLEIDLKKSLREGCSDDELRSLFLSAIGIKPEKHYINELPSEALLKSMSKIGG